MTIRGQFQVPIYDCTVYIVISDDAKRSLNYYLRVYDNDKIEDAIAGYCYRPSESIAEYYLFFDRESLDSNCWNHEKSHLVEFILNDRSIKATDEVRAYLDGYISKVMNKFLGKRKIKLK